MWEIAYWLYFSNAVLLICHEIDSAYWKEWDLFGMKGGISLFLILHFPMIAAILYGLAEMRMHSFTGLVFSLVLGTAGIFAFCIHVFFLARGRAEFRNPVSLFILGSTLIVSAFLAVITIMLVFGG
jgi:hypothetical protein